jgi:hypothetical protein
MKKGLKALQGKGPQSKRASLDEESKGKIHWQCLSAL